MTLFKFTGLICSIGDSVSGSEGDNIVGCVEIVDVVKESDLLSFDADADADVEAHEFNISVGASSITFTFFFLCKLSSSFCATSLS